jgi:hypothetical protein
MKLVERQTASVKGLVLAAYDGPGDSVLPSTPLQQVAEHVRRQLGLPGKLDSRRLVLSAVDGATVERATRLFASRFAPAAAADVLMRMWVRESRPPVSLQLEAGQAFVTGEEP